MADYEKIIPHILSNEKFKDELITCLIGTEDIRKTVYADIYGIPTIGIGYALVTWHWETINNNKVKVYEIRSNLDEQFDAINKTVSEDDKDILREIVRALNDGNINQATTLANSNFSFQPLTDDQAKDLLYYVTMTEYAPILKQRIGNELYDYLSNSNELIALLSITYQDPAAIKQPLIDALNNGNRAEAWYTIRYAMNQGNAAWKATRRYKEANEFGLYNTDPIHVTEAETKEIMRMYTIHETAIVSYEASYRRPAGIPSIKDYEGIGAAQNYLIYNFANGNTIDGKVKVGGGLDSYAYLGENINDNLTGTKDKNDLIFGEKGNDTLDGSTGTDVMIGGAGDDTYIVDKTEDVVTEAANEGTDTVKSSAIFTLRDNVDNLTLMGTENINGTQKNWGQALTEDNLS